MEKTFQTEGLRNKCAMCRADLPWNSNGYERDFHNIADMKSEEYETVVNAVTREGNLSLLKNLLTQKKVKNI